VCDLETSRIGAPYIYNSSNLRVKSVASKVCIGSRKPKIRDFHAIIIIRVGIWLQGHIILVSELPLSVLMLPGAVCLFLSSFLRLEQADNTPVPLKCL